MVRKFETPVYSGRMSDWRDFVSEWNRYIAVNEELSQKKMPESIKIMFFLQALDEGNRGIARARFDQGQTFRDVWLELERRCEGDTVEYHRRKWQAIELPLEGRNEDIIRAFRAEWEKLKSRVEDATPEEENKLLIQKIGKGNAFMVLREQEKSFGTNLG